MSAGAKSLMPPVDRYWGDRYARVEDPFGHTWGFGTRNENLTPQEIAQRGEAFFQSMGPGAQA